MKKVFLDTNILLDAALGRQYSKEAFSNFPLFSSSEFLEQMDATNKR